MGVFLIFMLISCFLWYANSQKSLDCIVGNVKYRDGQEFEMGCSGYCHCREGNIGCLSMCPPFIMPPECKMVKRLNDCCQSGQCNDEVHQRKCAVEFVEKFSIPWLTQVSTQVGGNENTCIATIVNETALYTNVNCVTDDSKVIFPYQDWKINAVNKGQPVSQLATIILDQPIPLLRHLHELNQPWEFLCHENNDDCALFLSSYDPAENKTENVMAKMTSVHNCNLNPAEVGVKCLEVENYPTCPNLDGTSVAVKNGDYFYMVGILLDGPSPKDTKKCDSNRSRYRKYREICSKTLL